MKRKYYLLAGVDIALQFSFFFIAIFSNRNLRSFHTVCTSRQK